MKALLLTSDDGISADIWLQHALACQSLGRPILAITEASNSWDAIGAGDGLPGYPLALIEYPGFTNRKVNPEDAAELMRELSQVPKNTVVLWNMSIFEWAIKAPLWLDVLTLCRESSLDMLLMHYPSTAWLYGFSEPADFLVSCMEWDYVAGTRIWNQSNRDFIFSMFPNLVQVLEAQPELTDGSRGCSWQVATTGACSLNLRAPYRGLLQRPDLLATLAWPASSQPEMGSGASPQSGAPHA